MTGKTQSGSPIPRRLSSMGRLRMASRPSVTPGPRLLVRVPGQRTREDGRDALLRLPYLAPIRGMGETRRGPGRKRPPGRQHASRSPGDPGSVSPSTTANSRHANDLSGLGPANLAPQGQGRSPTRCSQGRKQAMSYWEMATPLPLANDGVPGFPA